MITCANALPRKIMASDHVAAAPKLCSTGVNKTKATTKPAAEIVRYLVESAEGTAPFGPHPNQPQIAAPIKTICSAALANKSA